MRKAVFLLVLAAALIYLAGLQSNTYQAQASELAAAVNVPESVVANAAVPAAPAKVVPKVVSAVVAGGGGVISGGGPTPVAAAPVCPCCGIIWHADNQENGETFGESPIGGLSETCWIVGQTWTETVFGDKVVPERWTFAIRPGTVVWIRGHRGGTAWLFAGDEGAVRENIKLQAEQLRVRDGDMQTGIVVLPDQASAFRLIVRVQTNDNTNASAP